MQAVTRDMRVLSGVRQQSGQLSRWFSMASAAREHVTTHPEIRQAKTKMRHTLKLSLKHLSKDDMEQESATITQHCINSPIFGTSKTVGIYVQCERLREVNTSAILNSALQAGKTCFVPVVMDKHSNMKMLHLDCPTSLVEVPPFGILEPTPHHLDGTPRTDALEEPMVPLDTLFMPCLGVDPQGGRLGRGGGYYDKALSKLKHAAEVHGQERPLLVVLAFQCQMVETAPMDDHDQAVDFVVTGGGVVRCTPRARSVWPE